MVGEQSHAGKLWPKTKELLVDYSRKPSSIQSLTLPTTQNTIQGKEIRNASTTTKSHSTGRHHHLRLNDLTWGEHVDVVHSKAAQRLYFLTLLRRVGMPPQSMLRVFTAVVRSLTEYACPAWHTTLTEQQSDKLESIQQRALKIIFPDLSYRAALAESGLPTLCDLRESLCRQFFQAMLRPGHRLHHLLPERRHMSYRLRNNSMLPPLRARHERFKRTLIPYGLLHWQWLLKVMLYRVFLTCCELF